MRAGLPFLIDLIDDADSLVRCRAVEAVAAFGDREAVLPVSVSGWRPSGIPSSATSWGVGKTRAMKYMRLDFPRSYGL
ncbi:hypothetical protein GCM10009550_77680 [Actinocorallia libanotica]|uniref:HEAT repeat protein n=1 Tax=Actinocorallia libanotica TaxID=46162 RepID=A0ABN1S2L1_9ACTN